MSEEVAILAEIADMDLSDIAHELFAEDEDNRRATELKHLVHYRNDVLPTEKKEQMIGDVFDKWTYDSHIENDSGTAVATALLTRVFYCESPQVVNRFIDLLDSLGISSDDSDATRYHDQIEPASECEEGGGTRNTLRIIINGGLNGEDVQMMAKAELAIQRLAQKKRH